MSLDHDVQKAIVVDHTGLDPDVGSIKLALFDKEDNPIALPEPAPEIIGFGVGDAPDLPAGMDGLRAGYYVQGGRLYFTGKVKINHSHANFNDIVIQNLPMLPALDGELAFVNEFMTDDGSSPNWTISANEPVVGLYPAQVYFYPGEEGGSAPPGWYVYLANEPTHDVYLSLDNISYPLGV